MRQVIRTAERVLDALSSSFSPRQGATSREVRINGAISVAVGFVVLIATFAVIQFVPQQWSAHFLMLPSLLVYALWLIGGYRVAFGASPAESPGILASIARVGFGIAFIIAMSGLFVGLAFLAERLLKAL